MQNPAYIIVFGAAVTTTGKPSGAMKRRVESALLTTTKLSNVMFIVTGGVGANKTVSEAHVMKSLLNNSGIPDDEIILEDKAYDTLSSVINCRKILAIRNNSEPVYICSDTYHIHRCRWLFYLLGIRTKPLKVISGFSANGLLKWAYYYVREIVAIPFDTLLTYLYKLGIKTL